MAGLDTEALLDALCIGAPEAAAATFACGSEIDGSANALPTSLCVQGLGRLSLPLSWEDAKKLRRVSKRVSGGHGRATTADMVVRRAWQLEGSKLSSCPENEEFLSKTVFNIAAEALRGLGQDATSLKLEVQPSKLLYYEKWGHLKVQTDVERAEGLYATLILQLPTQLGHQGGALVVRRRGTTQLFDFSKNSSTGFHQMAFFAGCEHDLEKITTGMKLCLVFNLVRKSPRPVIPLQSREFLNAVSRTEAALLPWLEDLKADNPDTPQKLVIPLEHDYRDSESDAMNVSFAGLKGHDRVVVELLRSCGAGAGGNADCSLQLHLCTLTKHVSYACEEILDSDFEAAGWVGLDDRPVGFTAMKISCSELVVRLDGDDPFDEEPDEEEEEYHSGHGPSGNRWYNIAAVVIFPKSRSTYVACSAGFAGALDVVERKQAGNAVDTTADLRYLLDFCKKHPAKVWQGRARSVWQRMPAEEGQTNTCRLLKLCLEAGECADVVRLVKLLGQEFQIKALFSEGKWYPGIGSQSVARGLASAVKLHGWDACGTAIEDNLLLESRVVDEAESYASLARELKALGCNEAAVAVAKKTFCLAAPSLSKLEAPGAAAVAVMMFSMLHESLPAFVDALLSAEISEVCAAVVRIQEEAATKSIPVKEDLNLLSLFSKLCHRVCQGIHDPSIIDMVCKVMHLLFWLGDPLLLEAAVETTVKESKGSKNQTVLKRILGDKKFWEEAMVSDMGRNAARALAEERIDRLSRMPKPQFNWCQPVAQLPDHPAVEAFLRGPLETLNYSDGIKSLPQARKFAATYFDGSLRNGYSAKGLEGGRGSAAFCAIRKTRAVFESMMACWNDEQSELVSLRSRIQSMEEPALEHAAAAKRMKTDTGAVTTS